MLGIILVVVALIIAVFGGYQIQETSWQLGYDAAMKIYSLTELPYTVPLVIADRFEEEHDIFLVRLLEPTKKDKQTQFMVRINAHMNMNEEFMIVDEQGFPKIVSHLDISVTA